MPRISLAVGNPVSLPLLGFVRNRAHCHSSEATSPCCVGSLTAPYESVALPGEDAVRPLVLTVSAKSAGEGALSLTLSTMGGNVAATVEWPSDAPVSGLAEAIVSAVEFSDFDCPIKPLRPWNLRLIGQEGAEVALGPDSPTLAERLAGQVED